MANHKPLRILLDMDDVLVDSITAFCEVHGTTRPAVEACWTPGEWHVRLPISKALGLDPPMDEAAFWKPINGDPGFWLNLKPLPWLDEVFNVVRLYTRDWHIVSAPSECSTSYNGKVAWLKHWFGAGFDRFALTPHKYIFARPGVVLVDDRDSNVDAFMKEGGYGVVFPSLHNRQHKRRNDPLGHIHHCLDYWANKWNGGGNNSKVTGL